MTKTHFSSSPSKNIKKNIDHPLVSSKHHRIKYYLITIQRFFIKTNHSTFFIKINENTKVVNESIFNESK